MKVYQIFEGNTESENKDILSSFTIKNVLIKNLAEKIPTVALTVRR